MSWSAETIHALTTLWSKGETAATIARLIGGVSRNAVIGKANRLKLPARASRKNDKGARKPAHRRTSHSHGLVCSRSREPAHPCTPAPRSKRLDTKVLPPLSEPPQTPITTASLTAKHCHWPEGDPRSRDFHYCGRGVLTGRLYCPHHDTRAHAPRTQAAPINNSQK
jgi:GcrA cell cycle regulator